MANASCWGQYGLADNLHIGQVSHHFVQHKGTDWREKHTYLVYEHDKSGIMFGYLRNSYNNDSWLIGSKFFKGGTSAGEFGIKAGLVYGYEEFPAYVLGYWKFAIFEVNYLPTQMISAGFVFKLN